MHDAEKLYNRLYNSFYKAILWLAESQIFAAHVKNTIIKVLDLSFLKEKILTDFCYRPEN